MYGGIEGGRCHREIWNLRYRALCGGPSWRLHVRRGHSQIAKANAALFENRSPININLLTSLVGSAKAKFNVHGFRVHFRSDL